MIFYKSIASTKGRFAISVHLFDDKSTAFENDITTGLTYLQKKGDSLFEAVVTQNWALYKMSGCKICGVAIRNSFYSFGLVSIVIFWFT